MARSRRPLLPRILQIYFLAVFSSPLVFRSLRSSSGMSGDIHMRGPVRLFFPSGIQLCCAHLGYATWAGEGGVPDVAGEGESAFARLNEGSKWLRCLGLQRVQSCV